MAILNATPMWLIPVGVLVLIIVATEAGFRCGRSCEDWDRTEVAREASGAIKGAILGLGGLVLAFSYGMALARYDARTQIVVREAQALGACREMADLLPEPDRGRLLSAVRSAVEARLRLFRESTDRGTYRRISAEIDSAVGTLWDIASAAFAREEKPERLSRLLEAASRASSTEKERAAAVRNQMPAALLVLLVLSVMVTGFLMGHSSGQVGRRNWILWDALVLLMVLVFSAVVDLDQPNRGLIRVDHRPLEQLLESMDRHGAPAA